MDSTVTSLLGSAALVAAHGIVNNAVIGGKNFTFYQPYQDPYMKPAPERISRAIQSNGPVEDVTSIDIQCGAATAGGGTNPAKLVAKAAAGEEVTLDWTIWPDSHIGPTITYMAKCANNDCTTWQPGKDAAWFKIQEQGREGTSNNWGATPLMKAGNSGVKYTIPECIAPGQYLVRHEIIALHAAFSYPGAQFYPSCHQIEVTGSGSINPSDLVAFPGAYKGTDAGITYDAYKAQPYTIPGPKVFSCSGSGSGSAPVSSAAPAPSAPAATTAPATPSQTAVADDDEDCPATTTAAAPVATSTQPASDEEDDCPAETPSATSSAVASGPTAKEVDAEEDDCPAETPATTTHASPVATPTKAANDEEDDCPAETPSATPTPTQSANDDEDDCPAESTAPVVATPTKAANDDEDDCPAETPSATPTPTQSANDDEDDCPAESTAPVVAAPTAAAGDDEDDCPAETPSATPRVKRMTIHERRLV
ncbi:family 61 glycosyl hydrolase [Colletotrichum navitas]|uniref:lytic cellulose monooxygenase (C4-dehydrogenating) n=1 Tax=Colletotrichum navitas TaxID=681940 RepID=A0AAD8V0D3_9PEZI|nr:family 61 glycosyl hydrolase [Colletotrichum navitas]KAK1573135.1 family 61 glycosyl hydrolase [Colletotrichum navitas]